jgi:hypothetical protein
MSFTLSTAAASVRESHLYWGRPEDLPGPAQVRTLVSPQKGADLLAMGAAALAAVSVVFQERDPGYSQELLDTAQSLYLQVGLCCVDCEPSLCCVCATV